MNEQDFASKYLAAVQFFWLLRELKLTGSDDYIKRSDIIYWLSKTDLIKSIEKPNAT